MKITNSIKILFISFFFLIQLQIIYAQSKKESDSLRYLLKTTKYDTTKIRIRLEIGETSMILRVGYFDSIRIDCEKLINSSKSKVINITTNKYLVYILNNIGYIYQSHGNIPKALEYYNRSLKISEEIRDKINIINSLNNIGGIYQSQGDVTIALEYYNKSLKISEEIGDKQRISILLNNIGYLYKNKSNTNILEYYKRGLKISEEIGDMQMIAIYLNNIGSIYKNQGDISIALLYYQKCLKISTKIGDKESIIISLVNIGKVYLLQNDILKAKIYAAKAHVIAVELGFPYNIERSAGLLKNIYLNIGNYKEAFKYLNLEIKMRDSIANNENFKNIQKQQAKYEYNKKAAVDSIANSKAFEIIHLKIGKQKIVIYSFLGGFIITLIILIIIIRFFLYKRKANIRLSCKNEEITSHLNEIEFQRDKLDKQNQLLAEQKLQLENRQIIIDHENTQLKMKNMEAENQQLKQQIQPHFLFNSLYTLKGLIQIDSNLAEDYIMKLSNFIRTSISSNNVDMVKIKDELEFSINYLEMQKIRFGEALQYTINIPEETKNSEFLPIFVLQQLLENSIKHNALTIESPLNIKIEQEEDRIKVTNNIQEKLNMEKSTGIGLNNISERYKILSGDDVIINKTDNEFSVSVKIIEN